MCIARFGKDGTGSLPSSPATVTETAAFGEVVLCAALYGIWSEFARGLVPHVAGKVGINAANPHSVRDDASAQDPIDAGEGAGVPVVRLLPGQHLVRAFNTVPWPAMVAEAGRSAGKRNAIPLAGDNGAAREMAGRLIRDLGLSRWRRDCSPALSASIRARPPMIVQQRRPSCGEASD